MTQIVVERPKLDLVRALPSSLELREASGATGPQMVGHFAVFNRWTEIDSFFEGRFLERIAPGAFKKTFRENRDAIKVLAEHGYDPMIGKRALGSIDILREDEEGAYYEVSLVDAQDVRELILPRLRAKLYGASFRFSVMREEIEEEPEPSDENPHSLPERTIKECRLFEFGPVTFPAYAEATANARSSMRSLTDDYNAKAFVMGVQRMSADPRLKRAMEAAAADEEAAPVVTPPVEPAADDPADEARSTETIVGEMVALGQEFLKVNPEQRGEMEAVISGLNDLIREDPEADADEPDADAPDADEPPAEITPPATGALPEGRDIPLYGTETQPPWML